MTTTALVPQVDAVEYLVRVWDPEFHPVGTVTHGWRMDEPGIVVVPAKSPVWQAITEGMRTGRLDLFLTVDHPQQERWIGRLDETRIDRVFGVGDRIRAHFRSSWSTFHALEGYENTEAV